MFKKFSFEINFIMKEFIKSSALVTGSRYAVYSWIKKNERKLKKQPKQKYRTSVSVWFGQQNILSRHIHYANLNYTTV